MRKTSALGLVLGLVSVLIHAQGPQLAPAPGAGGAAANRLPVRRVVLYKSGVGYFEHLGKVRGSQAVTIDFTSGQLDDVLSSLTTLDLDGGRILGVSYNSENALDRRLGALRLPVGEQTTRAAFLGALRGARLEIHAPSRTITGRLLSVERSDQRANGSVTSVDTLSLVTDAGELQTVALDPGVSVVILDADLKTEVGRYLALVASVRDQDLRRLTIATSGTGERDLFVSYISEVPVWKPTYRLVLPGATTARKPLLQGWAIVDNTVGEDWDNVELSLVAGAPQSFVQAISRPYYVQRPVVPLPGGVQLSPQTHQSAIGTAGTGVLTGTVTDTSGRALPAATIRVTRGGAAVASAASDVGGRYSIPNIAPGSYEVSVSQPNFRTESRSGVDVSGGMETVLNVSLAIGAGTGGAFGGGGRGGGDQNSRASAIAGLPQNTTNITMDGVATAPNRQSGDGFFSAAAPRMDAVEEVTLSTARAAQQAAAAAAQLGDLFEYKLKEPVTIKKNQSALVPILSGEVSAEKVSLWNASSNVSRPLRAVWLTNATGLTLDGGSFSVIEGEVFAGEGLMESFKPGERRLLSYALDLGVQIDAKGEAVPARVTKVTVSRGLVVSQTEERLRRIYTARNEDTEARVVIVEHPARAGWTASGTMTPVESTSAWHRFRLEIAPKTTATFTVDDVHAGQSQYAVSSITDDQIGVLVRDQLIGASTETALRRIIAQKAEVARLDRELAARQSEVASIGRDQDRVRENMKSLKGSPEEKQLLQRYVKQLDDQENRLAVLRSDQQTLTADREKAQAELTRLIAELSA